MPDSYKSTSATATPDLDKQLFGNQQFLAQVDSWNYQVTGFKEYATQSSIANTSLGYKIKLRQGQLLVRQAENLEDIHLLSYRNEQFLTEWLQYSPAGLVRIDAAFGELKLKTWANLCNRFGKRIFLRIPRYRQLPEYSSPIRWCCKRSLDWAIAAALLIILSPLLLMLAVLNRISSPEPVITKKWCVGRRGKLFYLYNFRCTTWSNLDKLPQLFNILQGDMSFVGRHPQPLYDAINISPQQQQLLNALPGITGVWQVKNQFNLSLADKIDAEKQYLKSWSLWQDFKILLIRITQKFFGKANS
ncbi:heterocyst development glycosyltransferase HepC [Calothrix sp. NIES-2098]|uniref:heterocyst development glycosyltransferase HepC n=1 Tax=Calothrix sp. NIES-2098 TaxID=1954171 RepID=UPI000B5ECA8D|nr:sugar transferase [Calothrix sp. NIES-2098]